MGNTMNSKEESNGDGVKLVPPKTELKALLGGKQYKDKSTKKVTLDHLFVDKEKLQLDSSYDNLGNTALMLALKTLNFDVINYILHDRIKSSIDVTKKNIYNQNALMFAIMKNDTVSAKKIFNLIPVDKLKETINLQDNDGNTALMFFIKHCGEFTPSGYENTYFNINDFINAGADMNLKNKDGQTALDIAIELKRPKFQEILRGVSAPPQADGECWSSKSYKSKRKGKKMDGRNKRSGNRKKSGKKKSRK